MCKNIFLLVLGILLGATCAQKHDSAATEGIAATQDGSDQPSAVVLPVVRVRKDSDQKITVVFVNSGGNRSRPGVVGTANWSSRRRQDWRHVVHVVCAATDYS